VTDYQKSREAPLGYDDAMDFLERETLPNSKGQVRLLNNFLGSNCIFGQPSQLQQKKSPEEQEDAQRQEQDTEEPRPEVEGTAFPDGSCRLRHVINPM
jgi:hypothetical protein